MTPAVRVREVLEAAGATLVTAESLTGGQLAARITNVPGSSRIYLGGAVTYATEFKHTLLGVSQEIIDTVGVVSGPCAEAMASGVRALAGATYAVSTTGVAGPEEQDGQPVGTVYLGLAGPAGVRSRRLSLSGDRAQIQAQTCDAALRWLLDELGADTTGNNDQGGRAL